MPRRQRAIALAPRLTDLERDAHRAAAPGAAGGAAQTELPLFAAPVRRAGESAGERAEALREALSGIDPDGLSPREALAALYRLRRLLGA